MTSRFSEEEGRGNVPHAAGYFGHRRAVAVWRLHAAMCASAMGPKPFRCTQEQIGRSIHGRDDATEVGELCQVLRISSPFSPHWSAQGAELGCPKLSCWFSLTF